MKSLRFAVLTLAALAASSVLATAQQPAAGGGTTAPVVQATPQFEHQRPIRAANMAGKLGVVTEAAGDHFVIKTSAGEVFRINITEHTRIVGGPGHIRPAGSQGGGNTPGQVPQGGTVPATIPASDIIVGDYITSVGELDAAATNTINASMIAKLDAERVKEMKARAAEFGKSFLSGKVTKIDGTKLTINGSVDGAEHTVLVDENTSFVQRRDPMTLADIKVGDMIRIDGTGTQGSDFHATKISTMGGRLQGPNTMRPGGPTGGPGAPTTAPTTTPNQSAPVQPNPTAAPVPAPQ